MHVTYIGHAAILIEAGGTRILMDPWLNDPTYHGTWWHFPPLVHTPRTLPKFDYLYISHEHPDHFDPPTLTHLPKNVRIIIANFKRKRFRDRIRALGFEDVTELDFGRELACGNSGLRLQLIAPDRPWDDSAILLQHGGVTVLNVNDCHLDDATLSSLGERYSIDLAFLTFTGASQYPGCFDFPIASKIERWRQSKESHLEEFVSWARLLRTRRAVPAAGNYALLARDQLFLNTSHYVATPADAIQALRRVAPEIEGLQMNPGDEWTPEGGHKRLNPPPDWRRRIEEVERLSEAMAPRVTEYFAGEPEAPADLYDRFYSYFTGLMNGDPTIPKRVGICTWWHVTGPAGGDWTIDFTREHDWVRRGAPDNWSLRLAIPDRLVHKGVAGLGNWEDLILSFRVRLSRRPDRYMKDFWTWFCKL